MSDCVFCDIVVGKVPAHVVYEDELSMAFLDTSPQTRGHLQLIPKKHYTWVYDIAEIGQFFTTAQTIIRGIIPLLGADHVTIGSFGHQIAHAHLWIVPQYQTRVKLSERQRTIGNQTSQEELCNRMRRQLMKEV